MCGEKGQVVTLCMVVEWSGAGGRGRTCLEREGEARGRVKRTFS